MSLNDVKTLLAIESNELDELLDLIIGNAERQLLGRLTVGDVQFQAVPDELQWIVTEVAVIRYNRIGSEGMSSESVEGHSASYRDNDFGPYEADIERWLDRFAVPKKGVVRFL